MPWTLDDDAAFFAANGVTTSLGSDLSDAHARMGAYPHVAGALLAMWAGVAHLTGATSWGQAVDVMEDNPYAKAQFDVSCGLISIMESVVKRLESFFDPGDGAWMPSELAILKRELGAVFHEMTHSVGPADRAVFVRDRIETNMDDRAQLILEGATELRVQRDINELLVLTGAARNAPGILEAEYHNHYPAEVAFVETLFSGLQRGPGRTGTVLDAFCANGCSLRALAGLIDDHFARLGVRLDATEQTAAVEAVLDAAEAMRWTGTQTRALPTWDDYRAQIGDAAARNAITGLAHVLQEHRHGGVEL